MYNLIFVFVLAFSMGTAAWADELDRICFFPSKLNFEQINKTCKKGDLIRTRPPLAEMVCDWDKQIFEYTEDGQEWTTCVYHGKARIMDEELVRDNAEAIEKAGGP